MSRSWSSAHDWKSCRGQKLLESSNLSISAKIREPAAGRLSYFASDGEIRIIIEAAGGGFIRQCAHCRIPLFFRTAPAPSSSFPSPAKKCMRISPSPPKRKPPIRVAFFLTVERFECDIAHAGGVCVSQCAHWRTPLFFRTVPAPSSAFPSPAKKCTRISPSRRQKVCYFNIGSNPFNHSATRYTSLICRIEFCTFTTIAFPTQCLKVVFHS